MTADICRKIRATVAASGSEENVMLPSDVPTFASGHSDPAAARQRIIDLYYDLRPSLHAYLCALGVSSDQVEDIVQEVFLRLVRSGFERSTHENLRAWLFRVAHNLSMDVHRFHRRWSHNNNEQSDSVIRHRADPGPTPEQQIILD